MAPELRIGKMVSSMKADGEMIRKTVKVSLSILTAPYTKESGLTIRSMVKARNLMQMATTTRASGRITKCTAKALTSGPTGVATRATILRERSTATASICSLMEVNMKDNGSAAKLKARA